MATLPVDWLQMIIKWFGQALESILIKELYNRNVVENK
jgi:hypothetical protein